jgi:hypothetical protein
MNEIEMPSDNTACPTTLHKYTLLWNPSKPNDRPRWAEEGWDGLVADADPDVHLGAQVDPEDDGNDATHGNEQDLAEAGTTIAMAMAKAASEVGDERTNALKV